VHFSIKNNKKQQNATSTRAMPTQEKFYYLDALPKAYNWLLFCTLHY